MPNIYIVSGPNGSGKTTVFPRLLPNFYFENVLNMSRQMRGRNVPIQSRVISTPLPSELSNRINSQYSTIIQFFDPPVNSQQSTVNNNSGATGIDITHPCQLVPKAHPTH